MYPLSVTFPTAQGAALDESFTVPRPARYYLDLVCTTSEQLRISVDGAPEKHHEEIPCDLHVRVSDDHGRVHEMTVRSSSEGTPYNGHVRYHLLRSDDVAPGLYSLTVDSRRDITFLKDSDPTLELYIRPGDLEDQLCLRFFLGLWCTAGGAVGLLLVGLGLVRANRRGIYQRGDNIEK